MNVGELKETLESFPDDALIYVEADHGQTPYQANYINRTNETELEYNGEDIDFSEEENFDDNEVTAINIS